MGEEMGSFFEEERAPEEILPNVDIQNIITNLKLSTNNMTMLTNLYTEILTDDNVLYIDVIYQINPAYVNVNFKMNFMNARKLGLPAFESVSRARRKLQSENENLRGSSENQKAREERQIDMFEYSLKR